MQNEKNTQKIVFGILKRGEFVSGAELAKTAGVSRAAVWKAVCSLRKSGFAIEAVTNRGYRYSPEKSALNGEIIQNYLSEIAGDTGVSIEFFSSIDSTNNYLKRLSSSLSSIRGIDGELSAEGRRLHKKAVICAEQTAGRGRLGRSFFSGAESGIFLSLLYSPKSGVKDPALMTASAAVAVCRALRVMFGVEAKIKWVNDIFFNGKKICGILTEGVMSLETALIDAAIVGIGINVSPPKEMPEEIRGVAGFLEDFLNRQRVDKNRLAATLLCELEAIYDAEDKKDEKEVEKCLAEYRERSLLTGLCVKVLPVIGEERAAYEARVLGIADDLSLIVEKEDGEKIKLKSGEVTIKSSQITSSDKKKI